MALHQNPTLTQDPYYHTSAEHSAAPALVKHDSSTTHAPEALNSCTAHVRPTHARWKQAFTAYDRLIEQAAESKQAATHENLNPSLIWNAAALPARVIWSQAAGWKQSQPTGTFPYYLAQTCCNCRGSSSTPELSTT